MPNTSSAKKALRVSQRKASFNRLRTNKLKRSLKEFRKSLTSSLESAQKALSSAFSDLDKAAKNNTINKGTADRKKSRLTKALKKTFDQVEEGASKAAEKAVKTVKRAASTKPAAKKTTTAGKKPVKKTASKK